MLEQLTCLAAIDWPKTIVGTLILSAIATVINLLIRGGSRAASGWSQSDAMTRAQAENVALLAKAYTAAKQVMILTMTADGRLEDSEIEVIRRVYRQLTGTELSNQAIRAEASSLQASGATVQETVRSVAPHLNANGKELLIRAAFMVAAADGIVQIDEGRRMVALAQALNMPPEHFSRVIASMTRRD